MDLDRLVAHFRGPLIGLLASQGAAWSDAVELSLDCFSEAYLHREAFRGDPDDLPAVGSWLRGIARNLLRERRRTLRRLPVQGAADLDAIPARDVEEGVARTERRGRIQRAMQLLKPAHREVVFMHYFEKTSHRDVAALLGLSERAVEGRLYKARKALRLVVERLETQEGCASVTERRAAAGGAE